MNEERRALCELIYEQMIALGVVEAVGIEHATTVTDKLADTILATYSLSPKEPTT